jgi:hypothetical protein
VVLVLVRGARGGGLGGDYWPVGEAWATDVRVVGCRPMGRGSGVGSRGRRTGLSAVVRKGADVAEFEMGMTVLRWARFGMRALRIG